MLKSQKRTNAQSVLPKVKYKKQEGKMSYEEAYEMLSEMSEEERVEAFSVALGLLNRGVAEEEVRTRVERCRDIIEAVEKRMQKGGVYYIE